MRSKEEVKKEIEDICKKTEKTPSNHPNFGHLGTILVGLRGELRDIEKVEEKK